MGPMMPLLFITGTDTGAGKTVLTALLTRHLRAQGIHAAAFKPVCSGGREDARILRAAQDGELTLDEINPWHFRAPLAPALAARREHRRLSLPMVLAHLRRFQRRFDCVLVEGAGGLLSPLGDGFNSRDLIATLRATPLLVAPNQLGVVNHVLLTLEALSPGWARRAQVVLRSTPRADAAAKSNPHLLAGLIGAEKIVSLPWLGKDFAAGLALKKPSVRRALRELAGAAGLDGGGGPAWNRGRVSPLR